MTYSVTHSISLPPVTLPDGVSVTVQNVPATGGQQAVQFTAKSSTTKADAVASLQALLGLLQAAVTQ